MGACIGKPQDNVAIIFIADQERNQLVQVNVTSPTKNQIAFSKSQQYMNPTLARLGVATNSSSNADRVETIRGADFNQY